VTFLQPDDDRHDDDPNDPAHRDHDLSEAAPPWFDERSYRPWFARRWLLLILAIVVVVGLLLPYLDIAF